MGRRYIENLNIKSEIKNKHSGMGIIRKSYFHSGGAVPLVGLTVPSGQTGEICFRGYHVMKGYYRDLKAISPSVTLPH
ncbi:MAG: hypothetical protein AB1487_12605 [Thermodesulfobacteriota bacterium]